MEGEEQDRSEQPTSFKLLRARQKGSVARGMDLGFFTGLAAFLCYVWIVGPGFGAAVAEAAHRVLVAGPRLAEGDGAILALGGVLFSAVVKPLLLMAGTVFVVVALFEILQTGIVFSGQPLKPDFSRLNPAKGLKRLFSLKLLIETFKNVLKLAAYTMVAWILVGGVLDSDLASVTDAAGLGALMAKAGFRLLAAFMLTALVFAIADQMIVRRDFLKRMRMSRREVRREHREREGEPRLKQKRKQLHGDFAKASKSLRGLRTADVLIANPTHFAVALRYDPATMYAPMIVSLGADRFAQRLKGLAFLYAIPVVEDRALAKMLWKASTLGGIVPDQCFAPVANIYNRMPRKADSGES